MPALSEEARAHYFCISGVTDYTAEFPVLEHVAREVRDARRAFSELGMVELFPPDAEGLPCHSHRDLVRQLTAWSAELDGAAGVTVAVYSTGHGFVSRTDNAWRLAEHDSTPDNHTESVRPVELVTAVNRVQVKRVMLVLDACYAGEGAQAAFTEARAAFDTIGQDRELCIVAATPSYAEAQQGVFARALLRAFRDAARPSLEESYLSMESVERSLGESMAGRRQRPQVVIGRDAGSLMLPNPGFMPSELPAGWTSPARYAWAAPARGVTRADEKGWFFTGQSDALTALSEFATQHPPGILAVVGPAGSGRSSLVARVLTTATAEDRAALPVVTRPASHPWIDVVAFAVSCRHRDLSQIVAETREVRGRADGPRLLLLDDLDQAADPAALAAWASEQVAQGLHVVTVTQLPPATVPALVVDLAATVDLADVRDYLRTRTMVSSSRSASDTELDRIAQATGGSWRAAADAASAWTIPTGDRLRSALEATHDSLRASATRTLVGLGVPGAEATRALEVLDEVSSWDDEAAVPAPLWASLVDGDESTTAVLSRVHEHSVPGVVVVDAHTDAVRVDVPARPGSDDALKARFLDAVRPVPGTSWSTVARPVLAALAGAADSSHPTAREPLDDADFLLSAPPAPITRTLRSETASPGLRRAWTQVPASAPRRDRELALQIASAQSGHLDISFPALDAHPGHGVAVLDSTRLARAHDLADIIAATDASYGSAPAPTLFTAHDDGRLARWTGSPLAVVDISPPTGSVRFLTTCAGPSSMTAVGLTAAGEVVSWDPAGDAPPRTVAPAAGMSLLAARNGVVMLGDHEATVLLDLLTGSVRARVPLVERPILSGAWGRADRWTLWTIDSAGQVWQREIDQQSTTSPPARRSLLPGAHRAHVGTHGLLTVVHTTGITVLAPDRRPVEHTRRGVAGHHGLASTATMTVLYGSDAAGSWLRVARRQDGDPPRIAWLDEVCDVLTGEDEVVTVVARRSITRTRWRNPS